MNHRPTQILGDLTPGYLRGTVLVACHAEFAMPIPKKSRIRSHALKSAHQIRRERLEQLLEEFATGQSEFGLPESGRYTRFAEKVGTSAKSFSHVRLGRRNVGDALARRLEAAFGKPKNWMDTLDTAPLTVPHEVRSEMAEVLGQLLQRAAAIDAVETHRALLSIIDRRNVP